MKKIVRIFKSVINKIPLAKKIYALLNVKFKKQKKHEIKTIKKNKDVLTKLMLSQSTPTLFDIDRVKRMALEALAVWSILEQRKGNYNNALDIIKTVDDSSLLRDRVIKRMWSMSSDLGRHDIAIDALNRLSKKAIDKERHQEITNQLKYSLTAFSYYSYFINKYEIAEPKGYVVIFDLVSPVTTGLMVPISLKLLQDGYAVCSSVASTMPKSSRSELENISALIRTNGKALTSEPYDSRGLHNKWVIDWDSGVVSCEGVNYFTFFLERISKLERSYRGDLATEKSKALFEDMLRRSDLALVLCKNLVSLSKAGKPIRLVTMDTHFAPWGVVRHWCEEVGKDHGIHLIGLSIAYENYFSNLSSMEASTVSVEDMTANPDLRHPFLGGRHRFEHFLEKYNINEFSKENTLPWIKANRSLINERDFHIKQKVLNRIDSAKSDSKKVFCVMGKVLIDFAAPNDTGNVYPDFSTWLNKLVNLSKEFDALLIIKPHPHEIRKEIVQGGVENLRNLLPQDLPDSVIYLDHSTFNSSELAELVDCAFVWNGTVCTEFPILGCPVVAESIWAAKDYPLNSHAVKSEYEYEKIFAGEVDVPLDKETVLRSVAFLHFIKSSDVAIPFGYVRRAGTNQQIGPNIFYDDQVKFLESEGDENVDRAAARFFEFFPSSSELS